MLQRFSGVAIALSLASAPVAPAVSQTPSSTPAQTPGTAQTRQLGTVQSVSDSGITLTTSAGASVTVSIAAPVPVLQLPPGSTDLKTATPARLQDISVGDRVLVTGKPGDTPATLSATRVVLMKSTDIAARNTSEQQAWQHGLGGIVRSVGGTGITIVSGSKVLKVDTSASTSFKQYAADSVAFSDVKPAALASIQPGDQLRARGTVAEDHLSITADAIVFGSFENLSGSIASVDLTAQTLTLKDLASKKTVTVLLTQKSDLRNLPPQAEAAFQSHNAPDATGPAATRPADASSPRPQPGTASAPGSRPPNGSGNPGAPGSSRPRNAGLDLSQMLSRLPTQTLADLKPGQAVMIVASRSGSGNPTVVTLLSGVEQILSATPSGQAPITLSPWSLGDANGGGGGGGGGR